MRLRAVAEQTKIELSRRSRAVVRIDEIAYGPQGKPLDLQIEITRDEFVRQCADIIDRTFPVCQEALAFASLAIDQIDDVILVGGTTKIPYVRDQVARFFARAPRTDVNPEEAVAAGAALQATSLERILKRLSPADDRRRAIHAHRRRRSRGHRDQHGARRLSAAAVGGRPKRAPVLQPPESRLPRVDRGYAARSEHQIRLRGRAAPSTASIGGFDEDQRSAPTAAKRAGRSARRRRCANVQPPSRHAAGRCARAAKLPPGAHSATRRAHAAGRLADRCRPPTDAGRAAASIPPTSHRHARRLHRPRATAVEHRVPRAENLPRPRRATPCSHRRSIRDLRVARRAVRRDRSHHPTSRRPRGAPALAAARQAAIVEPTAVRADRRRCRRCASTGARA